MRIKTKIEKVFSSIFPQDTYALAQGGIAVKVLT